MPREDTEGEVLYRWFLFKFLPGIEPGRNLPREENLWLSITR